MLSIIAAVAKNNCIGIGNDLPWHIPEDLKRFKEVTEGKTVVMGRKTYESIFSRLSKPLPNRKNIVITSQADYQVPENVYLAGSLDEAIDKFGGEELFIIGGASVYKQAIDKADKLYITLIDKEIEGDAFFPEIDKNIWHEVWREDHTGFSFVEYKK